jgi:threonine dehydrogenase-like Zn-dependent dehydrogenase
MKALQITEPSVMKVVDIEKPQCGADEVLLKIHYVGFCGSDLNTYRGLNRDSWS